MTQTFLYRGLLFLSFLSLVLSFTRNSFGVAPPAHFERFADGSESMVFARIAKSERDGITSGGGLLLIDNRSGRANA